MSVFDGTDEPLSFEQALCEMAVRVAWPTEKHATEALRAIQGQFDMLPPEPDALATVADARDITLIQQDRALADKDRQLAEMRQRVEAAELEARLAVAEAGKAAATPDNAEPVKAKTK